MKQFVLVLAVMCLVACTQNTVNVEPALKQANSERELNKPVATKAISRGTRSAKKNTLALNSWQVTENKKAIESFVANSVSQMSKTFIPVNQRIAVFDLDGTLWVEKPQKAMLSFVKQELLRQVKSQPSLKNQQPWKSVLKPSDNYLSQLNFSTAYLSLLKAHAGLPQTVYDHKVKAFFKDYKHPEFKKSQLQLAYQPMQELMRFLQSYEYKVYIVDGSEAAFIRYFSQELFNVPPENVIGSSALLIWREGSEKLIRDDEFVAPVNDSDGKPVNIERYIGQRPVIAIGNDDSDIPMLNYVSESKRQTLVMILKHDDNKREYQYQSNRLEKLAKNRSWLDISMKNDFRNIF